MNWVDKLGRDDLIDNIAIYKDHPDFISHRDYLLRQGVYSKDIPLVKTLLEAGAGPDIYEGGDSLLHYLFHEYLALRSSQGSRVLELTRLLLTYGANPEHRGMGDWRAIDHCIESNLEEMVALFVEFGADPKQREYI